MEIIKKKSYKLNNINQKDAWIKKALWHKQQNLEYLM